MTTVAPSSSTAFAEGAAAGMAPGSPSGPPIAALSASGPGTPPGPAAAPLSPLRRRHTGEARPLARLPEEWAAVATSLGGRPFHGKQIFRWIHARGVQDPDAMTDLPGALRVALQQASGFDVGAIASARRSLDNTRKFLVRMADGATVETVLIPGVTSGKTGLIPSPLLPFAAADVRDADVPDDDDDDEADASAPAARPSIRGAAPGAGESARIRVTQCISTQVGCAMACVFCASGVAGLKRHLGADEIVAQVLAGRNALDEGEELRNVVYMGMGEPLHNYEATARSLRLLTHPEGIGLSSRRVTVSTSGLVPEIARLGQDFAGNIGLAISLHAADDETRTKLMPINRKYPLRVLMDALRAYPLPKRRRITIEYTLVAGRNDSTAEAKKVVALLRGIPVKVNLIPMNPIEASSLGPPDFKSVLTFQSVLTDAGYSCFIRRRRGDDVGAACGQLALLGAKPKVKSFRA